MQIQIESTEQFIDFDGVDVRVWNGVTEGGIPCLVFIHRLAVHRDCDTEAFEKELAEFPPPISPTEAEIDDLFQTKANHGIN